MKIEFEFNQHGYTFRDSIHLEDDHEFSDLEIAAIKQARFDKWYNVVVTPVKNLIPEVINKEQE